MKARLLQLEHENTRLLSRIDEAELRLRRAERRFRLQAGLAIATMVGAILISPASRSATAQVGHSLLARVEALEAKTRFMSVSDTATIFTGTNVHIRSGLGATNGNPGAPFALDLASTRVNALGNLIIGYNETDGFDLHWGSHNVIIGNLHTFTSFGGLIAGQNNRILQPFDSVSGGTNNTADGPYGSVSGGTANLAAAIWASVSGGRSNIADGAAASVSGGLTNVARGTYASVTGGEENEATGFTASITGGRENQASGAHSSISGGRSNSVIGFASIAGGQRNFASGLYASVSGGRFNAAVGESSSVSGGINRSVYDTGNWQAGDLFEQN